MLTGHSHRGGLTVEQLRPVVDGKTSVSQLAVDLDRSPSTVRYWLRRHGLQTQNEAARAAREAALRAGEREIVRNCARHGETEFALVGSDRRPRCKRCRAEAVARRRREVKRILVEEAGGRCALCGYNRSLAALEFHHRDPATKAYGIARRGVTRSLADLRTEAAKCVLLCANCHAEVEAGVASLA